MKEKHLINVDHIISISLKKEYKLESCIWQQPYNHTSRKWFKNYIVEIPGCYRYSGEKIYDIRSYFKNEHYVIRESLSNNEGPQGTVYIKSSVCITSVGGKYTTSNTKWFDSDREALEFLDEIESQYPDKFLIIKE